MLARDLERIRKSKRVPALAAAARVGGKLVEIDAIGKRSVDSETDVTADDKWHVGSCSKSMTATLAGILIARKELDWNSQIADVFWDWRNEMNSAWHKVTLEQLLCHHGGAPNVVEPAMWERACARIGTHAEQRLQLVRSTLAVPPDAVAGGKFIYSNSGYAIAGSMIETVQKKSWEDLLVEQVFRPLDMKSAGFGAPGNIDSLDQPCGHVKVQRRLVPLRPDIHADNPPAIGPGASVHCSLEDLLKYAGVHASDAGDGGDGALVEPHVLQRLHRRYGASEYAAGWLVLNRDWSDGFVLNHDGSNTFWFATMWLAPFENAAFVAASNVGGPAGQKACSEAVYKMIVRLLKR